LLPEALRVTLAQVGAAMADAVAPWWIVTGAAVALHGVATPARDVDVLIGIDDAERLFGRLGLPLVPGTPHARYRSALFGCWTEPPLLVEWMAGFMLRGPDGWAAVVPRTRTRTRIDVSGVTLSVPDREELASMLEAFGRPKDLMRAKLLRG